MAVVSVIAPLSPRKRWPRPATAAARPGAKTINSAAKSEAPTPLLPLAAQFVDVFDSDFASVAEVHNKNGETDSRFGSRDGENHHGEDLTLQIAVEDRE